MARSEGSRPRTSSTDRSEQKGDASTLVAAERGEVDQPLAERSNLAACCCLCCCGPCGGHHHYLRRDAQGLLWAFTCGMGCSALASDACNMGMYVREANSQPRPGSSENGRVPPGRD
jgi:hypothetical protein